MLHSIWPDIKKKLKNWNIPFYPFVAHSLEARFSFFIFFLFLYFLRVFVFNCFVLSLAFLKEHREWEFILASSWFFVVFSLYFVFISFFFVVCESEHLGRHSGVVSSLLYYYFSGAVFLFLVLFLLSYSIESQNLPDNVAIVDGKGEVKRIDTVGGTEIYIIALFFTVDLHCSKLWTFFLFF